MKTFLKIAVIVSMFLAIILTIPAILVPITDLIDTVFGTNMMIFLGNFYDAIPQEILDLIGISLSALTITIMISWLNGGIKS